MNKKGTGQKVLVVIPARYASTRFEGKPLAMIAGKPMIYHVYSRAVKSKLADDVIVATDDERIRGCVESFGGKAMMTSASHETGTDRIAEVAARHRHDVIVNVQGDEPLLDPEMISQVVRPLLDDRTTKASTLVGKISDPADFVDLMNVKAVMDINNNIMFMSRAPIPYPKSRQGYHVHKQIGIYAFRRNYLLSFAKMNQTPLEIIEGIELMRMLENGHRLKGVVTEHRTYSVDTPSDLAEVNRIYNRLTKEKRRS